MAEQRRARILRIDDDLYEAIAAWAQEDDRPVNTHMIRLLRQALVDAGRWPPSVAETRCQRVAERRSAYAP